MLASMGLEGKCIMASYFYLSWAINQYDISEVINS